MNSFRDYLRGLAFGIPECCIEAFCADVEAGVNFIAVKRGHDSGKLRWGRKGLTLDCTQEYVPCVKCLHETI